MFASESPTIKLECCQQSGTMTFFYSVKASQTYGDSKLFASESSTIELECCQQSGTMTCF